MPFSTLVLTALAVAAATPLGLHPENPRVFQFRGKATVLVTSGEHYGAVLNLDFDFVPYLDELEARGFNLTRTFSGTYHEVPGSFRIQNNTLAPQPGRYQSPWRQRDGKFDLEQIDPAYLARLKSFLAEASRRGVIAEFVLFCPFYDESLWTVNPMNARNNVNNLGHCPREEVYTLKHPDLLRTQLEFVRRVVTELNAFDNLYYEICNEPYFGGVTLDWQRKVSEAIVAAEKDLPNKHLIAQNIANNSARVKDPDPNVSIFNFHYASPPDAVNENRGAAQTDRLRRDRLQGHRRRGLSPPGLAVSHGRRSRVQQPGLLLHARASRRRSQGRGPNSRRRRARPAAAAFSLEAAL